MENGDKKLRKNKSRRAKERKIDTRSSSLGFPARRGFGPQKTPKWLYKHPPTQWTKKKVRTEMRNQADEGKNALKFFLHRRFVRIRCVGSEFLSKRQYLRQIKLSINFTRTPLTTLFSKLNSFSTPFVLSFPF